MHTIVKHIQSTKWDLGYLLSFSDIVSGRWGFVPKEAVHKRFMCDVLGSSEISQVGNLYLMKDWESKGGCEGPKGCCFRCNQIRTIIHDENMIAKRNWGYASTWEKFHLKWISSAEKYVFVSKNLHDLKKQNIFSGVKFWKHGKSSSLCYK